ncbi:MAG TPA: gfo/Idh/MocA family oxidoreductase, partial [Candidatus Hydrogenedens sp.]|nr:gfo/Idh/MocA family oxidoreductase [Candidatus Hydrogenedens sp.]
IEVLKHGKHVASAVPASFGSLEDAHALYETVKSTGLNYMLMETSAFRDDCYAMRTLYKAGALGELVYCEGEYYHYMETPLDSYKGWRIGLPPQWYPTHSNAYYICVNGGYFTEVSCMGMPSKVQHLMKENNVYQNSFGTEIALFRTKEGGMARMAVSWDTPGFEGEIGRVRGQKGSVRGVDYEGVEDVSKINIKKPPLPPTVHAGGHGGSHGYLTDEFIRSIIENRRPLIDIAMALNLSVSGFVAHQSALKDGELLKVPLFE